jgi:hypothetical protein
MDDMDSRTGTREGGKGDRGIGNETTRYNKGSKDMDDRDKDSRDINMDKRSKGRREGQG